MSAAGLWLGRLRLRSSALLCPLEGVSDCGFRSVCYRLGAGLTFTEMIHAHALHRGNTAAWDLLDTYDAHTLTGLQLLCSCPDLLLSTLQALERAAASGAHPYLFNIRAIDLNFGCPAPEVVQAGAGPALLHRRSRVRALMQVLARWREGNTLGVLAVGAKLRLGLNAGEAAQAVYAGACTSAAEEGLDWVTLHARHAGARSSAPPDWRTFEVARRALEAAGGGGGGGQPGRPMLIANGDVRSRQERDALMRWGAVDGVMLGRAAMRNPWLFSELMEEQPQLSGGEMERGGSAPSPPTGNSWIGGKWPTPEQATAAAAEWRGWASVGRGTRSKHRAYHEREWARLALPAGGATARIARVPRSVHMP